MGILKSKETKEAEKLEKLDAKMKQYGLENLSIDDKQRARSILKSFIGTTLVLLGSKAEDTAKIDLMQATMEQNFMIIKLLNEINNKLDK